MENSSKTLVPALPKRNRKNRSRKSKRVNKKINKEVDAIVRSVGPDPLARLDKLTEAYGPDLRRLILETRGKFSNEDLARVGKSEEVARVLAGIMDPKNADSVRIGSLFGSEPTTSNEVFDLRSVEFDNPTSTPPPYPMTNGQNLFSSSLHRSILRNTIRFNASDHTKIDSWYSGYDLLQTNNAENEEVMFAPRALALGTAGVASGFPSTGPGVPQIPNDPHGPYLYPGRIGRSDQSRAFWTDIGAAWIFLVSASPLATGVKIIVERLLGQEWKAVTSTYMNPTGVTAGKYSYAIPGYGGSLTQPYGDYLRFRFQSIRSGDKPDPLTVQAYQFTGYGNVVLNFDTVNVGASANTQQVFGHRPIKQIENTFNSISRMKVIGTSLWFCNTSQVLTQQGSLAACQVPSGTDWRDYVSYDSVSSLSKAYNGKAQKGYYGYLKPTDASDFDYLDEYVCSPAGSERQANSSGPPGLEDGAFDIPDSRSFLVFSADLDDTVARTAYVTSAVCVEGLSEDQWREVSPPPVALEQIADGVSLINKFPQHFENDLHLGAIWDWIKGAASTVAKGIVDYGPLALKAAAMLV